MWAVRVRGGVWAVRGGVWAVRGGVWAVKGGVWAVTLSPSPVALHKLCFP